MNIVSKPKNETYERRFMPRAGLKACIILKISQQPQKWNRILCPTTFILSYCNENFQLYTPPVNVWTYIKCLFCIIAKQMYQIQNFKFRSPGMSVKYWRNNCVKICHAWPSQARTCVSSLPCLTYRRWF